MKKMTKIIKVLDSRCPFCKKNLTITTYQNYKKQNYVRYKNKLVCLDCNRKNKKIILDKDEDF